MPQRPDPKGKRQDDKQTSIVDRTGFALILHGNNTVYWLTDRKQNFT